VSIMRLTAGLDSGPVCLAEAVAIGEHETYGSLAARLAQLGGDLLLEALDRRARGRPLDCVEQDERAATYAEKVSAEDRLLDPSRPAVELERVARALTPHIGARVQLADGSLLGVHEASPTRDADDLQAPPGVSERNGRLLLRCSPGALQLDTVQPPGGRAMDARDYLRGRGLPGRA
jgi:methionyl-tRNA formyltransferase